MITHQLALEMLSAAESVSLYRDVLKQPAGKLFLRLIRHLSFEEKFETLTISAKLFKELALHAEQSSIPPVGSLWQNYLLNEIITAENTFTRMSAGNRMSPESILTSTIKEAAKADLKALKKLLHFNFLSFVGKEAPFDLHLNLIGKTCDEIHQTIVQSDYPITQIKKSLLDRHSGSDNLFDTLKHFHQRWGYGIFCICGALRWNGFKRRIEGIQEPDPIRLEHLIGYENERHQVVQNTERLLSGLPASNLLLYGDRGTGKSSTVKALIHRYHHQGLRLIELPKAYLQDYPLIISQLSTIDLKFVLFVDDLSFEENEGEYRLLKSMMEGSLQVRTQNVVVYATSNRRHLVREYFDERRLEAGRSDTVQEKLSLSDRFGITVLFLSPDQKLYLQIVENLAQQKGIEIPLEELHRLALEWERWQNSRSGRTAKQFIDQLIQ